MNSNTATRVFLIVIAAVIVAVVAIACGRDDPEAKSVPIVPTFTPTPIVAIVDSDLGRPDENVVGDTTGGSSTGDTQKDTPEQLKKSGSETIRSNSLAGSSAAPPEGNASAGGEEQKEAARTEARAGGKAFDLAAAAVQLGMAEEALQAALGDSTQGRPDFAAAAQELGVTEETLIAALGVQAGGQRTGRGK